MKKIPVFVSALPISLTIFSQPLTDMEKLLSYVNSCQKRVEISFKDGIPAVEPVKGNNK